MKRTFNLKIVYWKIKLSLMCIFYISWKKKVFLCSLENGPRAQQPKFAVVAAAPNDPHRYTFVLTYEWISMPMLIIYESSEDNILWNFYFLFHFILLSSWEFILYFDDDDAMWKNKRKISTCRWNHAITISDQKDLFYFIIFSLLLQSIFFCVGWKFYE